MVGVKNIRIHFVNSEKAVSPFVGHWPICATEAKKDRLLAHACELNAEKSERVTDAE